MLSRALGLRAVHGSTGHSYLTKNHVSRGWSFSQIETLRLSVKSPILRVQKKFKSAVVEESSLYTLQTAIYVGGHRAQLLNVISWNRLNQVRLRSRALLPSRWG